MYEIEHLKSGLSISTHIGCPLNCDYCVLHSLTDFAGAPKLIAEPHTLLDKIMRAESLFLDGETPLIINNRTDPFLPEVIPYTKRLLELLCNNKIKSPIVIITKIKPSISFREISKELNLIVIYSYSGIERDYNYGHFSEIRELRTFFPFATLFHYYRPIIPGINDEINSILDTIEFFRTSHFDGTILSGFRKTTKNRYLMHFDEDDYVGTNHKYFKEGLFLSVERELEKRGFNYNLFRHTSCAIDCAMGKANRLNYYGKEGHCGKKCSNVDICRKGINIDIVSLMAVFQRKLGRQIDYQISDNIVEVKGELSQEEIAFAQNAYGVKMCASKIRNSPSEEIILNG